MQVFPVQLSPVQVPVQGEPAQVSLLINGDATGARDGLTFKRHSPLDGSIASLAPAASVQDAVAAVQAASAAFPSWSAIGPGERRQLLMRAAEAIQARAQSFADIMALETGASAGWARFNVQLAVSVLLEAAALTTQVSGEVIPSDVPGNLALAVRQPAGVVLGIAAWNAPVILAVRAIATPLACGNTVVLKGSGLCPATHGLVMHTLQAVGFPRGVLNFITNAPADAATVVEAMVAHPSVRRVSFMGSTQVGRRIASACANHLKPVVLELGGKAPFVVLDDADLDAAARAAVFGAFANSGQTCMATERIIVDRTVADAFVQKLADRAAGLPLGDPREAAVALGAVVDMNAVKLCNALIDDALAQGGRLVAGGKSNTTLMPATLIDHVTPSMRLYREEAFGPVTGIVRVSGVEEAVACANDNEYGLASAVFGRDVGRAIAVARRIESGICHVNGATVHDEAQMPFGGMKESGMGRFGGKAGIDAFTDLRWLTVQTTPRDYAF